MSVNLTSLPLSFKTEPKKRHDTLIHRPSSFKNDLKNHDDKLPTPKTRWLNPNTIQWKSYRLPEHLSLAQHLLLGLLINVYQDHTRGNKRKTIVGELLELTLHPGPCRFGLFYSRLSCSEYAVVTIAELGALRGFFATLGRYLTRCFMANEVYFCNFNDPIYKVKAERKSQLRDPFLQDAKPYWLPPVYRLNQDPLHFYKLRQQNGSTVAIRESIFHRASPREMADCLNYPPDLEYKYNLRKTFIGLYPKFPLVFWGLLKKRDLSIPPAPGELESG